MAHWTLTQRQKQAELIFKRKPWLKSTGPRTIAGKQKSAQNSLKHGLQGAEIRNFHKIIALSKKMLSQLENANN